MMKRLVLSNADMIKAKKYWSGRDPEEAVAVLYRQGLNVAQISAIVDKPRRTVYRWVQDGGARSKDEIASVIEDLPDPEGLWELTDREREIILNRSAKGFALFFEKFSYLCPGDVSGPLPPHILPCVDAYFDPNNELLMVNIPSRHWKSVVFSVMIPAYELVLDRRKKIILISRTAELATTWTRNIASIMREPVFVNAFGKFQGDRKGQTQWAEGVGSIRVLGGSEFSILSRGIRTAIFGRGADLLVADDPDSVELAYNVREGDKEFERFQAEALTRREPGAKVVVVMQRLAPVDFAHRIMQLRDDHDNPMFTTFSYPAVLRWPDRDERGEWIVDTAEVLDPVHWPFERLMQTRNLIGQARFSAMYLQMPVAMADGLMSVDTFRATRDDRKAWVGRRAAAQEAVEREGAGRPNPYVRTLSIDPSPTRYYGYVLADVAVLGDGTMDTWVLGCSRVEAKREGALEDFMKRVEMFVTKFNVESVIIEEVQFVGFMRESEWWPRIFGRPDSPRYIKQFTTTQTKNHVAYGVTSLAADFEQGRIHLPYGDPKAREMTDLLESEVLSYDREFPARSLSDLVMALWFLKSSGKKLRPRPIRPPNNFHFDEHGALVPNRFNASGRLIQQLRMNPKELTREQMKAQRLKEKRANKRADELVNEFVQRSARNPDEEEVYT
jgi:hypothetical protein